MAEWKRFELFEREAATLAALRHPSIPRFYGTGESADGTERWIAMELIDGEPLSLRIGVPSAPEELAKIFLDALDVLAYLHGRAPPVLHRDIKPHNLVVRKDGRLAVVDFGSVRTALSPEHGSTVVGTFGYLAPEQLHGAVSPSSDLYSLGVTMIALASGLDGANLPRKGLKIDVERVLAGYPDPVMRRVWARLVEPDPEARPRDVAAVRTLLEPAPAVAPEPLPMPQVQDLPPPPVPRWRPRGPLGKLVLFVVLLALGFSRWVVLLIARLILPGIHRHAQKRIARRYWQNEPRKHAELARIESRHALQQLRLDQAKGQVDRWRHELGRQKPPIHRHGRGKIPRGRGV